MKHVIILGLKGFAMGVAETIPGVSGGTIAFITGIYEKLLSSIKAIHPNTVSILFKKGIGPAWEEINGSFLVNLFGGMAIGIVFGVFGVSHALEHYPPIIWAFFFGLIISSAIYIAKEVERWRVQEVVGMLLAAVLAFWITTISPAEGNEALWFVFLSGAIAISALILPGISGSFILLIMGMYSFIIPTIKGVLENFNTEGIIIMLVFAGGCLLGLTTFARVLSWTFKNYRSLTLAILTGFMLGSLNKLWPWRNVISTRINSAGEEVPFLEHSVMPSVYEGEPFLLAVGAAVIIGFVSVFLFEKIGEKNPS